MLANPCRGPLASRHLAASMLVADMHVPVLEVSDFGPAELSHSSARALCKVVFTSLEVNIFRLQSFVRLSRPVSCFLASLVPA